jgi:hypothetical protein
MFHACNAIDGTGKERYPQVGIAARFKTTVRDALDIFCAMASPGLDFEKTRFPVAVKSDLPDERPDIADVVYGIHRRTHDHRDELPHGFQLTPHSPRVAGFHIWRDGKVELPASAVLGLLATAVFAPENKGQTIPDGYQLSLYDHVFPISAWWGWQDHFREIVTAKQSPRSALDFGKMWDDWKPL